MYTNCTNKIKITEKCEREGKFQQNLHIYNKLSCPEPDKRLLIYTIIDYHFVIPKLHSEQGKS